MSQRTNIYNYLYLEFGDKWYPAYDQENMLTAENQLEALYKFVGPGIITGWNVYKLADYRTNQLELINGYISDYESEVGQKLSYLHLNFARETATTKKYCDAATTSNITLSGEQAIDGVDLVVGNYVLVKNQTDASKNGVYYVRLTSWTRVLLQNNNNYNSNFLVYVKNGNHNEQTLWLASWIAAGVETSFIVGTSKLYFTNAFEQCVLVTPGNGIVSSFSAKTEKYNYFRYTGYATYFVWAEPSICLQSEGICAITSPIPPDEEYNTQNDAIYLASVDTALKTDSDYLINLNLYVVDEITYNDNRNDLKNFSGKFQTALRKAFYKHVHTGVGNNPSKIDLSSRVVLEALPLDSNGQLNYASNIFAIQSNPDFNPNVSATSGTGKTIGFYGLPEVRLNDVPLASSQYNLNLAGSLLSLKNNINSTDRLQISLPKSPQTKLIPISLDSNNKSYGSLLAGSLQAGYSIYLSDGTTTTITDSVNNTQTKYYNLKIWSNAEYLPAYVYIDGTLVDSDYYEINPYSGELIFKSTLPDIESYTYSQIYVVIEAIGRQIEGKLAGSRIKNINASSFNAGKLDQKRIINLDHIGLNRYKENAELIPTTRLFAEGNHTFFYPEIPSSDLQNNSEIYQITKSSNVNTSNFLLGNKRGLISSYDLSTGLYQSGWNIDKGRVKYVVDNILQPENVNYFKTAYALTQEGRVWNTTDFGDNWNVVKNPIDSTVGTIKSTAFYLSSDREEIYDKAGRFTGKYNYSYYAYMGTDNGLYTAQIADGLTENDWVWSKINTINNTNGVSLDELNDITAVNEISTRRTEKKEGGSAVITYDRTMYVGASTGYSGLYYGTQGAINRVFDDPVKGIYWIKDGVSGINQNDLIWWTDTEAFISHSARFVESSDETTTTTYWEHPLAGAIATSTVSAGSTQNLSATYSSVGATHSLTYNPYDESTLGLINVASGGTAVTGVNSKFLNYSGTGLSIGIGKTTGSSVVTWYKIQSIYSDKLLYLDTNFSGSSVASTSYVIKTPPAAFSIDGYTYSTTGTSQRALIKNQDNSVHNGVYYVSTLGNSTTNWVLKRVGTAGTTAGSNIEILNGNSNNDSIWFLDKDSGTITFGTSELNWKINRYRLFSTAALGSTITSVTKRNYSDSNDYILGHTKGIELITDGNAPGVNPTSRSLYWSLDQGEVNTIYSQASSASGLGFIYAGTSRGLYTSTDYIWKSDYTDAATNYPWNRFYTAFRNFDEVKVFDAQTLTSESDFNKYYQFQLIKLNAAADPGKNYVYERNYQTFYVKPWVSTGANVIVYIGKNPSTIPYTLSPDEGKITFVQSLKASQINDVYITIVREGAFLFNTGSTYHQEVIRDLVADTVPLTVLSAANTPSETIFYTKQPITDTALNILEFKVPNSNPVTKEQVIVNISYDERNKKYINTIVPRSSAITFPVNTEVYAVRTKKYLGIQDYLSKKQTNHTYYYESTDVSNTTKIGLSMIGVSSTIFDQYPTVSVKSFEKETGLKKMQLVSDVTGGGLFDDRSSVNTDYLGIIPSTADKPQSPKAIYSIYNASVTGSEMYAGTDSGVWKYTDTWQLIDSLDSSARVYYIKDNSSSSINLGADNGLWNGANDVWTADLTFTQAQFDYLTGSWFDGAFEAYGKEDGLSFVWTPSGATQFQSDHFKLVDKYRVNGLYKDKFIRITTDSQGNVKQTETDALYLCAEHGLFAVTNGANAGTKLTAFLTGRDVFDGAVTGYKYYKIFRALATPPSTKAPIPVFILTNNGILKVRNWRWMDPADSATTSFTIESSYLTGKSCFCFALDTEASPDGIAPGKSKIFIGTSEGVYRSFNEGNSFEKCERIDGGITSVYDLKIFTNSSIGKQVILAATEYGFWYSVDDGDSWYEAGQETDDAELGVEFSSKPNNNINIGLSLTQGGSLAQVFTVGTGQTKITKASAYIDINTDLSTDTRYSSAYAGNTLRAYIYATNSSGLPVGTGLSTSSTIYNPSDITYPKFVDFDFNYGVSVGSTYALVVKETIVTSKISLGKWKKSSLENPYTKGKTYYLDSTWQSIEGNPSLDLFFKVYFANKLTATPSNIPVGAYYAGSGTTTSDWYSGTSQGVIVTDRGHLTTDLKYAISMTMDDSASIKSSIGSTQYVTTIKDFFTTLWERTNKYVSGLGSTLETNYFDFWQFGTSIAEKSGTGFTNGLTVLTKTLLGLKQKGTKSELLETAGISIIGLSPQSISESILKTNDETNNRTRVNKVVQYLSQINSLRLSDLTTWYANSSKKQLSLVSNSLITASTVYVGKTSTGSTYTWSSADYPYVEVLVNGIGRTTFYSVSPTYGSVTFTAGHLLSAADTLAVNIRQDWDGTASGIKNSDTARTEFIRKWSETYKPLSFIFADGDNISSDNVDDIVAGANAAWNDFGVNVNTFGFGRAHDYRKLQTLSVDTNGRHFDILNGTDNGDLETSLNSFLHGEANDVFGAYWTRNFEYNDTKYIKEIRSQYSAASGSTCSVQFRWSKDRQNYSSWISINSGIGLTLKKEVTNLQYKINMTEGWSGSAVIRPIVTSLYHVEVEPSVKYLFSPAYDVNGSVFEYNLTSNATSPESAKLQWAICRGDSTDWQDYETIFVNKNGCLSNRQKTYQFSDKIVYNTSNGLTLTNTTGLDDQGETVLPQIFQVNYNGVAFKNWRTDAEIIIYLQDGITVIPSTDYLLDFRKGTVAFQVAVSDAISMQITYPERQIFANGEPTSTIDNRTYYLVNGRWPSDSQISVLINDVIVRGSYFENREEGAVTFFNELERTDIVTVFVLPSGKFRIGLQIKNYDDDISNIYSFGLQYSTLNNQSVLSSYYNTTLPKLTETPDIITNASTGSSLPISERMVLNYNFYSPDGSRESNTQTKWYRYRSGAGATVEIHTSNSLPNYRNRTVERLADLNGSNSYFIAGDVIYASVSPSDGFKTGVAVLSSEIILSDRNAPYIANVVLTSSDPTKPIVYDSTTAIYSMSAGANILVSYDYYNGEDSSPTTINNQTVIEWFNKDKKLSIESPTITLSSDYVIAGNIISVALTPSDGVDSGLKVLSYQVQIN